MSLAGSNDHSRFLIGTKGLGTCRWSTDGLVLKEYLRGTRI
jgi:hypothetical protein